nr:hypothetical protein [uncultured Sphingomonas sp.]
MMKKILLAALLAGTAAVAQAQDHAGHAGSLEAPDRPVLIPGHGNGGFPVGTNVLEAQAFFNNGMELAYAFEHKPAAAAFEESARLDPQCVMCAWGAAWSNGPTINYSVEGDDLKKAQALAAKADALANDHGTDFERQMTAAIVRRYVNGGGHGKKGDKSFLRAMESIAAANPTHDMVQVITADASLQAIGWEKSEELIKSGVVRTMELLTPVLARNPENTAAVHMYIHSSEMAEVPLYAEPFADRLGTLAPMSQHLVHMPSHTQYWIGRYRDAGLANLRAVTLGQEAAAAAKKPPEDGPFSQTYHAHNVHFGLGGAMMAGDAETALAIARPLVEAAQDTTYKAFEKSRYQHLAGKGITAIGLFAPDDVLNGTAPKGDILKSYWHYARGEALAARGDAAGVKTEAAAMMLPPLDLKKLDDKREWTGTTVLHIAKHVLDGRAAMIEGRHQDAITAFKAAIALEENKDFASQVDPPYWWYPVRRSLAEAEFALGDAAGAKADAETTLQRRPKDPGSLALLARIAELAAANTGQ